MKVLVTVLAHFKMRQLCEWAKFKPVRDVTSLHAYLLLINGQRSRKGDTIEPRHYRLT